MWLADLVSRKGFEHLSLCPLSQSCFEEDFTRPRVLLPLLEEANAEQELEVLVASWISIIADISNLL